MTSDTFGCLCINAKLQGAGNSIKWDWVTFTFVEVGGGVNGGKKKLSKVKATTSLPLHKRQLS